MQIPLEICEQLVSFGGPITAAKLAQTCHELYTIYKVNVAQKHTLRNLGTTLILNDLVWHEYWDIANYIIYLRVLPDDDIWGCRELVVLSKQTKCELRAKLYCKFGIWISLFNDQITYNVRNCGLFDEPPYREHRLYFNIDGKQVAITITTRVPSHELLDIRQWATEN